MSDYMHEFEEVASRAAERIERRGDEYRELKAMLDRVTEMVERSWDRPEIRDGDEDFYTGLLGAMVGLKVAIMERCPHDSSGYAVEVDDHWEYRGMRHTRVEVTCLHCDITLSHQGDTWGYPPVPIERSHASD